jgi:hypothetical protein
MLREQAAQHAALESLGPIHIRSAAVVALCTQIRKFAR